MEKHCQTLTQLPLVLSQSLESHYHIILTTGIVESQCTSVHQLYVNRTIVTQFRISVHAYRTMHIVQNQFTLVRFTIHTVQNQYTRVWYVQFTHFRTRVHAYGTYNSHSSEPVYTRMVRTIYTVQNQFIRVWYNLHSSELVYTRIVRTIHTVQNQCTRIWNC